jgi:hypothetical protein
VGICTKVFQEPTFGPPIPPRLFAVIGEENREHFLNARRSIARSLGIGAYAYYRRIVEGEKFNLVASVLKVAEATNSSLDQIALLKKAQHETQFSKAIAMLRDASAIPSMLLIDGENPLAILHDILSQGVHAFDDAECLARAQHAEVVLCEIVVRINSAVSDKKAVKDALASVRKKHT